MTWALFVDSSNTVSFYPKWDMKRQDKKQQSEHRTRAGNLYRYNWGSYDQFRFSVDFVNSSDAAIVNSWWASDTELLFMDEDTTQVHSVLMMSKTPPLTSRVKPMIDQFKGTIDLSTY